MQYLLEKQPNLVNLQTQNKATPLHFAVSANDYQMVLCLLKNNADVNLTNNFGQSPLHLSVVSYDHRILQALLSFGANVDLKDSKGNSPIDIATERKKQQISNIFAEYLANKSKIRPKEDVLLDLSDNYLNDFYEESNELPERDLSADLDVLEKRVDQLKLSIQK